MNLTEMELVKSAVSDAGPEFTDLAWPHSWLLTTSPWIPGIGVTAELFWFHDKGYFEEFLDGKSGEISTWILDFDRLIKIGKEDIHQVSSFTIKKFKWTQAGFQIGDQPIRYL